jgi:hypothetical protein
MQFPKSLHAEGWHAQMPTPHSLPEMPFSSPDADESPSPRTHRRLHALIVVIAVGALVSSAGLDAVDDPRPLDVQLTSAIHKAGDLLKQLQQWVSHGLQVSLSTVADSRDLPAARAPDDATVVATASGKDREQPVMPDLQPDKPQIQLGPQR